MAVDRPPDKQGPVVGLLVPPEPGLQAAAPQVLLTTERGLYAVTGVHADEHVRLVESESRPGNAQSHARSDFCKNAKVPLSPKGLLVRERFHTGLLFVEDGSQTSCSVSRFQYPVSSFPVAIFPVARRAPRAFFPIFSIAKSH